MNALIDIVSSSWAQALGWTLLHTLWQSLLCLIVVITVLRFIPLKFSSQRYAVATAGLMFIFITATGTFVFLNNATTIEPYEPGSLVQQAINFTSIAPEDITVTGVFTASKLWIQSHLPMIVIFWGIGAVLFSLRMFGGWWYIRRLRRSASVLETELNKTIQKLAARLNINRAVTLAESSLIHAPVVIGYLKPLILMPLGMCAGLTTEQLETIFLHELVHIRRGDHFMNLVQSFLEAMFFFNPFVWVISGIMRREREYCCDDAVVRLHENPLAYARALATLEEVRLSRSGLALSLAEDKNQLLNRIKRIMEKSVQNYSGRERMVPLILLIVGLVCASWLTIQSGRRAELRSSEGLDEQIAQADTTIKNNSSSYYRREVIKKGEDGEPDVQIIEETEGDYDPMVFSNLHFDMDVPPIPPMPDFDIMNPPTLDLTGFEVELPEMPEMPEHIFVMDTFPRAHFDSHEWEEVSKAFEENFKERFSEFFENHEEELQNLLEDVQNQVNENVHHELEQSRQALADAQEQMARVQLKELSKTKELIEKSEIQAEKAREFAKRWEESNVEQMAKMNKDMKKMEEKMKSIAKRHKELEKVMQEELIKDGYLRTDEKLNNLDISNDHIEVNGKKIKASDEKKYRKMVDQFRVEEAKFEHEDGRKE